MAYATLVQILKLNDVRKGVGKQSGNPYEMQDAECILLNDDGTVAEVGVLMVPKDLMGKVQPGTYSASFALQASKAKDGGRRIGAVFTNLVPVPPQQPRKVAS